MKKKVKKVKFSADFVKNSLGKAFTFLKKVWQKLDEKAQHSTRLIGIGEERQDFIENLAMLLESGMDIIGVLEAMEAEMKSKGMKAIINQMKLEVENGSSLWKAIENSGLFSDYVTALIRIGEESGQLDENLQSIIIQQKKDKDLKSKLKSAMMYPVLVLGITVLIGIGISWFILPKLATVFDELNLALPLVTRILIDIGVFMGSYGSLVVPLMILAFIFLMYLLFFYKKTRHIGYFILLHFPLLKKLIQQIEVARFGYTLGALLQSGLAIEDALQSASQATSLPAYRKFYLEVKSKIEEGKTFQDTFNEIKKSEIYIPKSVQQMINAAYRSGNLAGTLLKIGDRFERKTELTTKNLSVVLEPILLVIVWLGVVALAMAIILPIYNLVGGFNANPI